MRNPTTVAVGARPGGGGGRHRARTSHLRRRRPRSRPTTCRWPSRRRTTPRYARPPTRSRATAATPSNGRSPTPRRARELLEDKEVYGILEIGQGPAITIVTSGAVNPQGTQVAQQMLTGAAQGLAGALAQQQPNARIAPPQVETVHPASTAGRTAPLAASALLWIGGLVGGHGVRPAHDPARHAARPRIARLTLVASVSVLATGAVVGLLRLWDSSLNLSWEVLGFLALTAVAFAGRPGRVAPPAQRAGRGHPGPAVPARARGGRHRAGDAGPGLPDAAVVVDAVPLLHRGAAQPPAGRAGRAGRARPASSCSRRWRSSGCVVILWPGGSSRSRRPSRRGSWSAQVAEPDRPRGVVDVRVDQADRLPGAEREPAADDGDAWSRAGPVRAARGPARALASRAGAATGRRPGSRSRSAASRSSSLPAPVSMTARPAVACGTQTFSRPSAAPTDDRNFSHSRVRSCTTSRPPVRT